MWSVRYVAKARRRLGWPPGRGRADVRVFLEVGLPKTRGAYAMMQYARSNRWAAPGLRDNVATHLLQDDPLWPEEPARIKDQLLQNLGVPYDTSGVTPGSLCNGVVTAVYDACGDGDKMRHQRRWAAVTSTEICIYTVGGHCFPPSCCARMRA